MNRDNLLLKASGMRRIAAALSVVGTLSACVSTTPQWDQKFGETVNMAIAQQTLNPDASRNTNPVSGIDGRAAREAVDRYQKSFGKPEPQPNVFTIGVSSSR